MKLQPGTEKLAVHAKSIVTNRLYRSSLGGHSNAQPVRSPSLSRWHSPCLPAVHCPTSYMGAAGYSVHVPACSPSPKVGKVHRLRQAVVLVKAGAKNFSMPMSLDMKGAG